MFIDSHAHLEAQPFETDRPQMLQRARSAAVDTILAIGNGTGPGSLDCAINFADRHDWIYATVGIHPHEAKLANDPDFDQLRVLAQHPKVLAWGEIGLDYFYDHSPRQVQRDAFVRQMILAREAALPVIIHCRPAEGSEDAWDDCLALLQHFWAPSGLGGVLHCFTGSKEHAAKALQMGFLVSFAGNITFPKAESIRQVAGELPLETILIETDSPFLAPLPYRGKRNEPAFVVKVAEKIAELHGVTPEDVGSQTTRNFYRLFKRATEPKTSVHAIR